MIIHVETLEDKRLETYVGLTEIQLRNRLEPEKGIFIAESEKVIVRALDAGYEPLSLLIPEHRLQRSARLIERIETQYALEEKAGAAGSTNDESIPIFVAPSDEIEKLTGFELTRGVLCAMKRKPLPSLADLLADAHRVAVLEDITNHTNVGAVFRNAAALGFDALIVSPGCCDPLYRRASRVSMGNVFLIPWTYLPEDGDWTALLHSLGFCTVAMALRNDSVRLDDPRLKQEAKLAVVMGTEGDGLASSTIASCDYTVRIPMYHGVDSLNVAAASAVAFYELGLPPLDEKEN